MFRRCIFRNGVASYAENQPGARVRLDLVRNPLGPPGGILPLMEPISRAPLDRYPPVAELPSLKSALAERFGIPCDGTMLTCGADHAIEVTLQHLVGPGEKVAIVSPTFMRFGMVAANLCDAKVARIRSIARIPAGAKAVVLCTPNNPTTEEADPGLVRFSIRKNPHAFFIIDAVFSEFGSWEPAPLAAEFPNVAVLKSFSKTYGLPGIRVGFIASSPRNICNFRKGVSPFMVPQPLQHIAAAALGFPGHIEETKRFLSQQFERISGALGQRVQRLSGVPFYLLFVENADAAKESLLAQGIATVSSSHFRPHTKEFLRILIGAEEENSELLRALDEAGITR